MSSWPPYWPERQVQDTLPGSVPPAWRRLAGMDSTGLMIQLIDRQFVRTTRPLYGHLVSLLESAISRGDLPSGSRVPPERELAQRLQYQPHHGRQCLSRARVARLAARIRRPRHVRVRRARSDRRPVCVARQDRRRRAPLQRLDAEGHDSPLVGREGPVARGGRAGNRLLSDRARFSRRSIT